MNYYFSQYSPSTNNNIIRDGLFLVMDNWDDFHFVTVFHVYLINDGVKFDAGSMHIGVQNEDILKTYEYLSIKGLTENVLNRFPDEVFSLGDLSYYSTINNKLMSGLNETIFSETNDIAYNKELFQTVKDNSVVTTSFFRDLTTSQSTNTYNQLNRVAHGGPKFLNFSWQLCYLESGIEIDISNNVKSILPTNSFALIGNNGVGKTSLLKDIVVAANAGKPVNSTFLPGEKVELINNNGYQTDTVDKIVNLVFISFSSFDIFNDDFRKAFNENKQTYKFVGNRDVELKEHKKDPYNSLLSPKYLGSNFETDLEWIFYNPDKAKLLKSVMKNFEWDASLNDFCKEAEEVSYTDDTEGERNKLQKKAILLSSGQKIILLIVASLIKSASENSVFLIDEPELYLHPPYVLALVMTINEIAEKTNSICIITTHSAITVQEIPNDNVYTIFQSDLKKILVHPKTETFGTNTQTINDEVFGLDIRSTGYYKLLYNIVHNKPDEIDDLINSGKLGGDALLYLDILRDENNV